MRAGAYHQLHQGAPLDWVTAVTSFVWRLGPEERYIDLRHKSTSPEVLKELVQSDVIKGRWKQASSRDDGRGVDDGADLTVGKC